MIRFIRQFVAREGPAVGAGPSRTFAPIGRLALLSLAIPLAACSSGGRSYDSPRPGPAAGGYDTLPGVSTTGSTGATALSDSVRAILFDRRWNDGGDLVDSVFSAGISGTELSGGDAIAVSALLRSLGEEDRAARLLLDHPSILTSPEGLDALRESTHGLSLEELESLRRALSTVRAPERAAGTVHVEYAKALALIGEESESGRIARTMSWEELDQPDRETLDDLLTGRIDPISRPVRVGAVLSLTGRFARVGEDLGDGIRLAVAEWNATAGPGEQVELIMVDDRSDPDSHAQIVAELGADSVSAIVGPIRSMALADIARLRSTAGITIVSPTAAWDSAAGPNAFSMWDRGRRETAIGEALGQWFPERMELFRLAALYPDSEGGRAGFRAFESAALASGAVITEARMYESDSTTYQQPIEALVESDPEGVFVLADDANTLLQLAPQLSFYGLRSRVVAGGETWSEPEVLRRLEPSYSEFKVIATFLDRSAPGPAWMRFQESYEREYRRPLPDNLLPALGYDAVRIITENLSREVLGRPGALTRAILDAGFMDGATGRIRWTRAGLPAREVAVKMVRDRKLVDADPEAISTWAEEARLQEELQKEIEEEEAERKAARERSQP